MSDIVTNAEVEDVLSSIRRLVGDNKRSDNVAAKTTEKERFVLTPQLRVAEQDVLLLQPEDEVAPSEDWYEFEEPPLPDPLRTGVEPAEVYGDDADHSRDQYTAPEDASSASALSTMRHIDQSREEDPTAGQADAPSNTSSRQQDFFALSAKIAALETAIAKTADQWDPDDEGRDAYAGTQSPRMTWQNDVEFDAMGKPLRADGPDDTSRQTAEEAPLQHAEDILEEQIIDEDMLREMVADIVRSELQGELGERITRNVRKLVRREIHRALTAQTLD